MFKWQYTPSTCMYVGIHLMSTFLALARGMTPLHIILANPALPFGGLAIASKYQVMERFRSAEQFLPQCLVRKQSPFEQRLARAQTFLERVPLPIIAKPDRGVVGIGVFRIDSRAELGDVLHRMPADYLLQEYCRHRLEYGIFYCKHPGQPQGQVVSLTRKIMPEVVGDGHRTVRQLVQDHPDFVFNRAALLAHARQLDYVPPAHQVHQVIIQGSHTYGAIFKDCSALITPHLEGWINGLCQLEPEFHFGRFDMKLRNPEDLDSGQEAKICELNGCWSEPIQIYDDRHCFSFALSELWRSYARAYRIAAANRARLRMPVPIQDCISAFRTYLGQKKLLKQIMG